MARRRQVLVEVRGHRAVEGDDGGELAGGDRVEGRLEVGGRGVEGARRLPYPAHDRPGRDEPPPETDLRLHGDVRAADGLRARHVARGEVLRPDQVQHGRAHARRADDDARRQLRPVGEEDASHASVRDQDPSHAHAGPDLRAQRAGQAAVRLGDDARAALRVAEPVVAGHAAKAVQRLAGRDLPVGQDEVEPEEEAEEAQRRRVVGERGAEVLDRAVVPRAHLLVAHREDVREEADGARGLHGREAEGAHDADTERGHARELRGDRHAPDGVRPAAEGWVMVDDGWQLGPRAGARRPGDRGGRGRTCACRCRS